MNTQNTKQKVIHLLKIAVPLLFGSGIALFAIQTIHSHFTSAPTRWSSISEADDALLEIGLTAEEQSEDNKESEYSIKFESVSINLGELTDIITYTHKNYLTIPVDITTKHGNKTTTIVEGSFILDLNIINNSDNAIVLDHVRLNIKQSDNRFPTLCLKEYLDGSEMKLLVKNIGNFALQDLTVLSDDGNGNIRQLSETGGQNSIGHLGAGDSKTFTVFHLQELIKEYPHLSVMQPYIIISDAYQNTLRFQLGTLTKASALYDILDEEVPLAGLPSYNITTDILLKNDEIPLKGISIPISPHEACKLQIEVSSDVPCFLEIQPAYRLNNKEYLEDTLTVAIYTPDSSNKPIHLQKNIEPAQPLPTN